MEQRSSKRIIRTLIETNGINGVTERYEIQYEVGENEVDSIAQAQALQLFIDNYSAAQAGATDQPQPVEEESILPDLPLPVPTEPILIQDIIEIAESDEEKEDVKPDIKYIPPPPAIDPDDLEAQISASVILIDEFKNSSNRCSINDTGSKKSRLSRDELLCMDKSGKTFTNEFKQFASSTPATVSPILPKITYDAFKNLPDYQKLSGYRKISYQPKNKKLPTKQATKKTLVKPTSAQSTVILTTITSSPVNTVGQPPPSTTPLPRISKVCTLSEPAANTNNIQQKIVTQPSPSPIYVAPPTPVVSRTIKSTADPQNILTATGEKTLAQISEEDMITMAAQPRPRGRQPKRVYTPRATAIKTSVITSTQNATANNNAGHSQVIVPKIENVPAVQTVTYQEQPAQPTIVDNTTFTQNFSNNQPTAVLIDGQYYLLQAITTTESNTVQQAPPTQQIVNQSLQPFLQQQQQPQFQQQQPQFQQQQQQQPPQFQQQLQQLQQLQQQPVDQSENNRYVPIMIVNQPNFHISSSNTPTTSANQQTIILTDEQYNNFASQQQFVQQQQQPQIQQVQQQPVPIQIHTNPFIPNNEQQQQQQHQPNQQNANRQTQVIVTPVTKKIVKQKNLQNAENSQFIDFYDLEKDVNNISKKYY